MRYLFLDGVAERLAPGSIPGAGVGRLGVTASGTNVLLGLYAASKEDTASARECLRDLKARGMHDPVRVATDGAPD